MPKKISKKCNVFLQLIILHPHPYFTRLKIRRSANPHFTGGQSLRVVMGRSKKATDDGTLLAARIYATRYVQSDGTDDGSGTDDGDVSLLGLRKFFINSG